MNIIPHRCWRICLRSGSISGKLKGISLVYMGDARYNMGNSLMIACAKLGMHFTACTTKKYFPNEELVALCRGWAEESGGTVTLTEDVKEGTKNADVIYTDVWVSMGEPDEVWEERIHDLTPYKVTAEVMRNAGENAIFLHCLPSFHDLKTKIGKEMGERFHLTDMEVTDEVFESPQSLVFDEAENRMHTIKGSDGCHSGNAGIMESDMYDQNTITEAVHTKWAGKTVHFVKETDSTNEWAKQLSRQGAPHGTLAAAEFQSAGKGRLGRIWKAPEGSSVMMSPSSAPLL